MSSRSQLSFINGLIAGAGLVLALMSYGFLQFIAGLENIMGVTTTELRVAILLGALVSAVAIGYEFYNKEKTQETKNKKTDKVNAAESTTESSSNE